MALLFISHSRLDDPPAIALRDWLFSEGWDDVFLDLDPQGISPGRKWERALHEEAHRCEAVICMISKAWLASEWCLREMRLALRFNKRIFALLLDGTLVGDLPPELGPEQAWSLGGGIDHELFRTLSPEGREAHVTFSRAGLAALKAGLSKAGLDPKFFEWPPQGEPERAPWRGMSPLEAQDAGVFFGREAPILAALDQIRGLAGEARPGLLVVLGASGAGKSSFLRAGLLPRLGREDRRFAPLPVLRPERAAISGEAEGLVAGLEKAMARAGLRETRASVAAAVAGGVATLQPLLARLAEAARVAAGHAEPPVLVLALDQAEEAFNAEGAEEAGRLLALLAGLARLEHPRVLILATIRSDAYERLQRAPALEGVRQNVFSLPPLPQGSWATIVEGPAARMNREGRKLRLDPALTAALLNDAEAGGGRDALPLLAFALGRLYREYGGDGDLTLAEYQAMGGMAGAVEAAVERALKRAEANPEVPRDRRARLDLLRRGLIPWLAGIDPDTGAPRRLSARLSDIPPEAQPLIEHLVEERLLSKEQLWRRDEATGEARPQGEAVVEPVHEALLRRWTLLRGWLEEDASRLSGLEALRRAAREWRAHDEDSAWLAHRAGRLEDAENLERRPDLWARLDEADRAYLAACRLAENRARDREIDEARKLAAAERAAADRQRQLVRRTRLGAAFALVLSLAVGIAGAYGLRQAGVAEERAVEARMQEEAARQAADRARRSLRAAQSTIDGVLEALEAPEMDSVWGFAEIEAGLVKELVALQVELTEQEGLEEADETALLRSSVLSDLRLGELSSRRGEVEEALRRLRPAYDGAYRLAQPGDGAFSGGGL